MPQEGDRSAHRPQGDDLDPASWNSLIKGGIDWNQVDQSQQHPSASRSQGGSDTRDARHVHGGPGVGVGGHWVPPRAGAGPQPPADRPRPAEPDAGDDLAEDDLPTWHDGAMWFEPSPAAHPARESGAPFEASLHGTLPGSQLQREPAGAVAVPAAAAGVIPAPSTEPTAAHRDLRERLPLASQLMSMVLVMVLGAVIVLMTRPGEDSATMNLAPQGGAASGSAQPAQGGGSAADAAAGSGAAAGGLGGASGSPAGMLPSQPAADSPSSAAEPLVKALPAKSVPGKAAGRLLGKPPSGLPWHSGFWLGGVKSASRMNSSGTWRGRPMDIATTYGAYGTWAEFLDTTPCWAYHGFKGRLSYGLPLLPRNRKGQWNDVLSGKHDATFREMAAILKRCGFPNAAIRVGLEANGNWYPWGASAKTAAQYRAAFRRVVKVMRREAPQLTFWFDISVSDGPLPGTSERLAVFKLLYPGDDVVDGIAMDHFDFYSIVARNPAQFAAALRPPRGVGLADGVEFARKRGKGFAVPEWGLHAKQGAGDNPFFMKAMFNWFQQNRDVLVFESYFNESAGFIRGSIWSPNQNPRSAAVYRSLWGRPAK